MPSKKRKLNFDIEDAEKQMEASQKTLIRQMADTVGACNTSEAADLLTFEEFISFAAFKFGYTFINNVISALNVVPDESEPWRPELVKFLTRLLSGTDKQLHVEQESTVNTILHSSTLTSQLIGQGDCYRQVFAKIIENTESLAAAVSPREKCDMEFPLFAGCIAPPTKFCLLCHDELKKHNSPTHVTYYLPSGPLPFVKVELRCRSCELNYGITKYGNSKEGYTYYNHLGIVEASDVVYIDRLVMTTFTSLSHHAWVSATGFAEAYNEAVRQHDIWRADTCSGVCEKWRVQHGDVSAAATTGEEPTDKLESTGYFLPLLSRRALQEAFWNDEVHSEILEQHMEYRFMKPEDREACMVEIEKKRTQSTYTHNCYKGCKERGCGKLLVTDGIWKLSYPICLYKVPVEVDGVKINMPNCCPNEPQHGKPFCKEHSEKLKTLGVPGDLLGFIKHFKEHAAAQKSSILDKISSLDVQLDNEAHEALEDLLIKVGKVIPGTRKPQTTADAQGSTVILEQYPELAEEVPEMDTGCRKDTGDQKKVRKWSRGYQFIIGGGGHIEAFTPLYQSESPSQVFIFLVNFLRRKLENISPDEWSEIFVAYDNICNIERMKVTKEELPFPAPYNQIWKKISKIIDTFHLKNHKRVECHQLYNPKRLKESHPSYNTQACEQTFAWLGRFHRILSSMPKIHNNFFLHRLVKRRNSYSTYCYQIGRKPVLPNSKYSTT